jgi:hypothetical protein
MSDPDSFLLVRHPRVMDTLRAEVSSGCGTNSDLSRDDLRRLPYLQKVLKESMLSESSDEQCQILTIGYSFAALSVRSCQYKNNNENNGTSNGWWSRSEVSGSHFRRECRGFQCLFNAQEA